MYIYIYIYICVYRPATYICMHITHTHIAPFFLYVYRARFAPCIHRARLAFLLVRQVLHIWRRTIPYTVYRPAPHVCINIPRIHIAPFFLYVYRASFAPYIHRTRLAFLPLLQVSSCASYTIGGARGFCDPQILWERDEIYTAIKLIGCMQVDF